MRIEFPDPPFDGPELLGSRLGDLLGDSVRATEILGDADPAHLAITQAHPVYQARLEQLRDQALFSAAELTGWRYLLVANERVIAAVDVWRDEQDQPRVSSLWTGPIVDQIADAVRFAETLEPRDERFELAILDLPAVYFVLLWLRPVAGGPAVIVPVTTGTPGFEPRSRVDEATASQSLATIASDALAEDEPPQEQDA